MAHGRALVEPPRARPVVVLTSLDAQLLENIAIGASTMQIAHRLHLSRQGVEYRISALFRRFRVPNRTALVARAYAIGALRTGSWPPRVSAGCLR